MKGIVVSIILALFFLAACAQQQGTPAVVPPTSEQPPAQELPPIPMPPAEDADAAETEVKELNDGLADAFGPRNATAVLTATDITCDRASSTVTFRFRNLDTKSWQLNQKVSFPAPADLTSVRILLNNYEMNGQRRPIDRDGKVLFGPKEPFSENCGGIEVLKPGEEAVCTVTPVSLKSDTGVAQGANELFINSLGPDGLIRFKCE